VWLPALEEQTAIFRTLEKCDLQVEMLEHRIKAMKQHRAETIEKLFGSFTQSTAEPFPAIQGRD